MDDNLTDQQRAEQIWTWLKENGWYLVAGIVIGLGGLFGWRQWDGNRLHQAEQASALYAELLTALRAGRASRVEEITAALAQDFPSTPYLDQARLALARVKMDGNQPEEAARYLREVVGATGSEEMRHIARLRLARVLLQQENYDEALKALESAGESAFTARYHEVRGDAFFAMGRTKEARAEYEAALTGVESGVVDPALIQAKIDELSSEVTDLDAGVAADGAATN